MVRHATVMASPWVVAPPAVLYLVTCCQSPAMVMPEVINPGAGAHHVPARDPTGTTLAWAHFVAFDLFVGPLDLPETAEPAVLGVVGIAVLVTDTARRPRSGCCVYLVARVGIGGANVVSDPA